jgi:tetratricopeptide (TPR) repeat protein
MRTEGCRVMSAMATGVPDQGGMNLPELAQKLGVQIFFEGSVRQEEQWLRITARIITADGFQLWSQRFETSPGPDELFSVSEQVVRSLINRTRPELTSIRKLKASAGSDIWDTYPAVLSAESLLDEGTSPGIRMAVKRFEEVQRESPRYPRPLCGIAQCYYELALRGAGISAAAVSEAKRRAQKASEFDPELVLARGSTAALLVLEWNWKAAEECFQEALALGSHAATYRQYSLFLAVRGRFEEAWHFLQKAQHADPFSWRQKLARMRFFHISRRYQEAGQYSLERPVHGAIPAEGRLYLALTYLELGQVSEAARIAREVERNFGAEPAIAACLAEVCARCGETLLANDLIVNFRLSSDDCGISRFRRALLALALDDQAGALSLLLKAYEEREPELIWLAVDPRLDAIRSDPRFVDMTRSVMSGSESLGS